MASTAETLTAQAPSPGVVPAAEAAAAGSLASLATQVGSFQDILTKNAVIWRASAFVMLSRTPVE